MRLRTFAATATAIASLALLSMGVGAASAAPAPLPEGDTLYGIACPFYSTEESQLPNMQLIELDTQTAAGTLVGEGTPALTEANCGGQGAWNPVTSTAYALAQDFTDETATVLVSIDPVSGLSTFVGDFSASGVPIAVYAIAISPTGVAYAFGDIRDINDDITQNLYTLDLGTGDLTLVGETGDTNFTLAFDPSTGILYTVDTTGFVYAVDTLTGAQTEAGFLDVYNVYSFAIDSSGTFWFAADVSLPDGVYEAELYSAELSDLAGSAELAGTVSVGETTPYIEALLLTYDVPAPAPAPAPQLAATGSSIDSVAVGGALVLLLGGIAAVAFRRTRGA